MGPAANLIKYYIRTKQVKISGFLFRSTIVAALGGLLFGFDTAVISGTVDALREVFELSSQSLGFTVASALIGTIIGAICVGWPTDRFGRRTILIVLAIFYFVSAVGSGLAWDWYSFLVFRFLGGLAVGGATVVAPMYIAEISPAIKLFLRSVVFKVNRPLNSLNLIIDPAIISA